MQAKHPIPRKVLIAEDDSGLAGLLKSRLEDEGFEADIARDGLELLRYIGSRPEPLCVVLDLEMPGKSGIDTIIAMKDRWREAKIYVFTAYPEYRDRLPVLKFYVDDFFSKTELDRLIEAIRS